MELFPPPEVCSAEWIALHNLEAFVSVLDAYPCYVEWLNEEYQWNVTRLTCSGPFWIWLDAVPGIEEAIARLPMRMKLAFIRVLCHQLIMPDECLGLFRALLSCDVTKDDHWVILGAFLGQWCQCTDVWEAYAKLYAPHLDALECVVLRAKIRGERPSVPNDDWEFWSFERGYGPTSLPCTLSDFDGWFDLAMSIIGYCRQEFPKDDGQVFEEYLESQGKMVPA